ncbi:MAG TPA: fatty acid desaturase [Bryobacteraceae bacterium]|nr:fatty acid desaturase [Bryobacteraceae bacterium]
MPAAILHRRDDRILVGLTAFHTAVLLAWPGALVVAAGIWWNANTISHNFIHRPFFRWRTLNCVFSAVLTVLLGFPQTLWRERHLAHHAGMEWRWPGRRSMQLAIEILLVAGLWATLARFSPGFFVRAYLPGYIAGLALCAAQGRWEHSGGRPVSHYGRLYNFLCFNDGYHAEHHAVPGAHWSQLSLRQGSNAITSPYPALLRWLELVRSPQVLLLECMERTVLRFQALQRFVVHQHRRAIEELLPRVADIQRITIVGGGLFPRTALILGELAPEAQLTIIDATPRNIEMARPILKANIEWRNTLFEPGEQLSCGLAIIPLCFCGEREAIYREPPAPAVLVHDWIWRRRGQGATVSWLLLKRINLIRQ